MIMNNQQQPQTLPVPLGEVGRGRGICMKIIPCHLSNNVQRLTVRSEEGGDYRQLVAALRGTLLDLSTGLEPVRLGEVR